MIAGAIAVCLLGFLLIFNSEAQTEQQQTQKAKVLKRGLPTANQNSNQPTPKELDDAATPIVNLNDVNTGSADRRAKNSQYDGHHLVKSQLDPRVADVVKEGDADETDLPTDKTDLVVEGRVTESAAFLSNDGGDVYSEFTIRVTEVLKSSSNLTVNQNDSVTAEREGGRVKYPDGRVIHYGIVGHGSPMRGKKYLFFLSTAAEGNYRLLTAYELQGSKVFALDGSRMNDRHLGRWSFDKHNDETYADFRKEVDAAIKNPPTPTRSRRIGI
jgi:hypothetical protein